MKIIPALKLAYGEPASTYVGMVRTGDEYPGGEIGCTMKLSVKDVDPASGGVAEDQERFKTAQVLL